MISNNTRCNASYVFIYLGSGAKMGNIPFELMIRALPSKNTKYEDTSSKSDK